MTKKIVLYSLLFLKFYYRINYDIAKIKLTRSDLSLISLLGIILSLGSPLIDAENDGFLGRLELSLVVRTCWVLDAAAAANELDDVVFLLGSIIVK